VTMTLAYLPSPSQGIWHLGPFPVRAYALFIIVGIVVALVIGDRRWEARGGERGVVYDIALWAVPFGLIGGRLYHIITDWKTYFGPDGAGLAAALRIWDGGLGIWGAVALGGVGAWIGCRRRGIPLPAFGDAIAPGIVLAQAIGRIGNYFNQELYGRATTLPWGLEIFERRDANGALDSLNGVSTGQLLAVVHPTFLYELLWNVLIFVVLILVDRRFKMGHGRLFALYVAGYCVGRFWVELMRNDAATQIAGIRINSFTSTFVFIGAVVYIMVAPKGREDPATLRGKPEDLEEAKESPVDEVAKELAAVAATTGVVAAAKVAGDEEDEGEKAAEAEAEHTEAREGEETEETAETKPEPEAEVEAREAAVAEVLDAGEGETAEVTEAAAETEPEADEGEETAEPEPEADVEAEDGGEAEPREEVEAVVLEAADTAEVTEVAAETEPEAKEADTPDESGGPAVGLGAVEGEEAVEVQVAAGQVHESAVEGADAAEAAAAKIAEEPEVEPEGEATEEPAEAEEPEPAEAEEPEAEEPEAEQADTPDESGGPAVGLGAVEGEEAVEVQVAAGQVHESAVEGADAAEAAAAEIAEEPEAADPPYPADAQKTEDPQGRERRWWRRRR
jgi:prolipoprotein diacylglyceryl transferase